jgi:two-component system response regulator CpxR
MRPKKVVLCVNSNADRLGQRVFLLETHGRRVARARTATQALTMLRRTMPGTFDLLMMDLPLPDLTGETLRSARRMHPAMRTLIIGDTNALTVDYQADVFLPKGVASPAEVIERVRILLCRKRGPQPQKKPVGSVRPETRVEEARQG